MNTFILIDYADLSEYVFESTDKKCISHITESIFEGETDLFAHRVCEDEVVLYKVVEKSLYRVKITPVEVSTWDFALSEV